MPESSLIHRLPRHLKMAELRVFVAVLEHRSFHKAAAALHLTQPAVTKAVAGLEQTLGVKLFDRHAHGVEPTALGTTFAPRAAAIFDELRRAAQDLKSVTSGATGSLRIGTVPMPAIPFVPVAIKRMVDAQPNLFVAVVEERETDLVDRLRRRDVELAILRLSNFDLDADLQVAPLFDEQLCVIAAKDHPLAGRKDLTWPELLRQRWVMPPADCFFFEYILRTFSKLDLEMPRHVVEAFSIQFQFNMALHGGMLSFGLRSQIDFTPGKDFLVRLPFELPTIAKAVGAVSLKSHDASPLAQQFVAHVRDLVAAGGRTGAEAAARGVLAASPA